MNSPILATICCHHGPGMACEEEINNLSSKTHIQSTFSTEGSGNRLHHKADINYILAYHLNNDEIDIDSHDNGANNPCQNPPNSVVTRK